MPENTVLTDQLVQAAIAAAVARQNVTDIYFVACGGSYALMFPNQYAVDRLGKGIAGHALNAAEFKARSPARLGKGSVVILCSLSGTTPETVEAAKFARAAGALTISLTSGVGSPLDEASEHTVFYKHEPLTFKLDHAGAVLARLTFGILAQREASKESNEVLAAISRMPELIDRAVNSHAVRIDEFAEARKRETVVYTMASGSNFGVAYSYAICIFQEMQWMHSAAIHAGEYFHGPFEITDFDVPFLVLRSLGPTKTIDDRAIAFARKHSSKVTVLDSAELGLEVMKPTIVEYVEHLMFNAMLRNYAQRLSFTRGHPLTVRRYMWQMEY